MEEDVVIVGRCPSQGSDGALPMRVKRRAAGETSMRVPLEICSRNNGDFDGDEMWLLVPISRAAVLEAEARMNVVWSEAVVRDNRLSMWIIMTSNVSDETVDQMMYTTMIFDAMSTYKGGEIYNLAMLKPKVWKQMLACMSNSHFHNESMYEPHLNGTFQLRYWFDAQNYRDGGPVILSNIGEGSGGLGNTSCRPLHDLLLHELANATGGLLVAIEHRYYGNSIPIPYDGPASLRFLTTQQALADNAYFAQHVNFEGLNKSLTAPGTAYIAYGVSYAGGFSAFLRTQYPNLFFGKLPTQLGWFPTVDMCDRCYFVLWGYESDM